MNQFKKIFFFDVETNGLPSRETQNRPTMDAEVLNSTEYLKGNKNGELGWPRIWQFGWQLAYEDGTVMGEGVEFLIPPFASGLWEKQDGHPYEIDLQACLMIGKKQSECFPMITEMMHGADTIVCHNLQFDSRIFEAEMYRIHQNDPATVLPPKKSEGKDKICTMMKTAKLLDLPYPSGKGTGKWPTLEELHTYLFGVQNEGAHDALADVKATARCYFELKKRNVI